MGFGPEVGLAEVLVADASESQEEKGLYLDSRKELAVSPLRREEF